MTYEDLAQLNELLTRLRDEAISLGAPRSIVDRIVDVKGSIGWVGRRVDGGVLT